MRKWEAPAATSAATAATTAPVSLADRPMSRAQASRWREGASEVELQALMLPWAKHVGPTQSQAQVAIAWRSGPETGGEREEQAASG
eukprot:CAMPEP_0206507290 /NCGR_PEP_ID=MMETSP0324_2-20121206/57412_1 /ASSEMBLY_ACC=CAM_ASM_000836 /TAXON_ID=2866 /ORGANISM="Crypthecodinium cohnii, Strain Seligo" /LENGTH=86 /DNA_ID=CAMNT_0053997461 /DNA_START=145 /DNA_END=401 /DNA_ORIENTATION=+